MEFDGTITAGRKGMPYDWRSVLAEHASVAQPSDEELARLLDDAAPVAR